ncbi:MAG: hypothetical protein DDT18_01362 [Actinobacteria bacterium]|nr:hypothetical protein [Actinomycetota bacterium]
MGSAFQIFGNDLFDLDHLGHQIVGGVHATCCIDDKEVAPPGLGRLQGVEDHCSGISTPMVAHYLYLYPITPVFQLLNGRGPKGISSGDHNFFVLSLEHVGHLGYGSSLAHAIYPYH